LLEWTNEKWKKFRCIDAAPISLDHIGAPTSKDQLNLHNVAPSNRTWLDFDSAKGHGVLGRLEDRPVECRVSEGKVVQRPTLCAESSIRRAANNLSEYVSRRGSESFGFHLRFVIDLVGRTWDACQELLPRKRQELSGFHPRQRHASARMVRGRADHRPDYDVHLILGS